MERPNLLVVQGVHASVLVIGDLHFPLVLRFVEVRTRLVLQVAAVILAAANLVDHTLVNVKCCVLPAL